jgi:hypothetical protein
MQPSLFSFARNNPWLRVLLCILPIAIYVWVFKTIALNVNYVAFDDITILGIIPEFDDAPLLRRWQLLTTLFPEHRLVFSRSVILILHSLFGKVDLVWPMIIANICWALCTFIFYLAFARLNRSFWYFLPVIWLWFNIQSFENIFWGVSSLCNFGVLLFVLSAIYFATFQPRNVAFALLFATAATFTYGNGLMVFPVIGLLYLLAGYRKQFAITVAATALTAFIYFMDFTPITQNLDFTDPRQVREGFFGLFGFIGSITTVTAYGTPYQVLYLASVSGMLMILGFLILFRNQYAPLWNSVVLKSRYTNQTALFAAGVAIFVGITAVVLTYKRIPTDTFQGMFKGRYRMYSTLWCVALYLGFLAVAPANRTKKLSPIFLLAIIGLNFTILHKNFADAVNNRRAAIVQEFNARYNADWLGLKMFSMDQVHYEKIRTYYQSEDPLAEGWSPLTASGSVVCDSLYQPDTIFRQDNHISVYFKGAFNSQKDYSDGAYVLLKSPTHTYASAPNQPAVPLKTTIRRRTYFLKSARGTFHEATVEPGIYQIYLLLRTNGKNKIYCTGKTWVEEH